MTEEYDLDDTVQFFRDLLHPVPVGAATLEEISQGFSEPRARRILDDPELLHHLRQLASRIELGHGWTKQALGGDTPASTELYLIALEQRPDRSRVHVEIIRDGDTTVLLPEPLRDVDLEHLARVDLPGGWAAWHPADPGGIPVVGLDGPGVPDWVPELLDVEVCEGVVAGRGEAELSTLFHAPHPLGRYALGQWLRSHSMPALPDSVLRVEMGALAVEHADLLGGQDAARDLLSDAGPLLVDLFGVVGQWEPPRRELAEVDLHRITTAALGLTPELPEAVALKDLLAGARPSSLTPHIADAFALAAGGDTEADDDGANPLVEMVTEGRLEVLELLDDGLDWDDDPGRPFIAELIILG